MSTEKPTGIVNIRGKEYQTVALRVSNFRTHFEGHALTTEVLHRDADCVVMKATISNAEGRVVATGHAEEYRKASDINKTSALENAETSAIGRALAALGIGGTEFASADEVARAVGGHKGEPPRHSASAVNHDAFAAIQPEEQDSLRKAVPAIVKAVADGNPSHAKWLCEAAVEELTNSNNDPNVLKMALWAILDSKTRSAIKAADK
jgi:hypothetical protein